MNSPIEVISARQLMEHAQGLNFVAVLHHVMFSGGNLSQDLIQAFHSNIENYALAPASFVFSVVVGRILSVFRRVLRKGLTHVWIAQHQNVLFDLHQVEILHRLKSCLERFRSQVRHIAYLRSGSVIDVLPRGVGAIQESHVRGEH